MWHKGTNWRSQLFVRRKYRVFWFFFFFFLKKQKNKESLFYSQIIEKIKITCFFKKYIFKKYISPIFYEFQKIIIKNNLKKIL